MLNKNILNIVFVSILALACNLDLCAVSKITDHKELAQEVINFAIKSILTLPKDKKKQKELCKKQTELANQKLMKKFASMANELNKNAHANINDKDKLIEFIQIIFKTLFEISNDPKLAKQYNLSKKEVRALKHHFESGLFCAECFLGSFGFQSPCNC